MTHIEPVNVVEGGLTARSSRQKFRCPACRSVGVESGTDVAYTRLSSIGDRIVRRRRCLHNSAHTFMTVESAQVDEDVDLWIRRSTDGKIESRFSSDRLRRDIRRVTFGRITDSQLQRVVGEVTSSLASRGADLGAPLTEAEREHHGASARNLAVWDVTVLEVVETSLNETETRIPHVLYALGVRGQTNLAHRAERYAGFSDATAFLTWLFMEHNYGKLRRALPDVQAQRSESWWSPTNVMAPETVIKRSGDRRAFDLEQFQKSIGIAMRGRSRWVVESKELSNWVLVQVEGQRKVTTTQLSALISLALRRTDDIAYLRWAIASKGLTSVAEIADEAEDLIRHPSVRLRFSPDGQPRIDAASPINSRAGNLAERLRALASDLDADSGQ